MTLTKSEVRELFDTKGDRPPHDFLDVERNDTFVVDPPHALDLSCSSAKPVPVRVRNV